MSISPGCLLTLPVTPRIVRQIVAIVEVRGRAFQRYPQLARSVTAAKQIDAPLIAVENWFEELRARLGN